MTNLSILLTNCTFFTLTTYRFLDNYSIIDLVKRGTELDLHYGGYEMSTIAEKLFEEVATDEIIMKATSEYTSLLETSDIVATNVLTTLLGESMDNNDFTLDEMMLGLARSMAFLSRLYFESEQQHHNVEQMVRSELSERVSDAIISPMPCLSCENCNEEEECENPVTPNIPFAAIPILSTVLVEEAYWKAHLDNAIN